MNAQLQKLAIKASIKHCDPVALDAFARLILGECSRQIVNTDLEDVDGGDSSVLHAASQQLRQHFGI